MGRKSQALGAMLAIGLSSLSAEAMAKAIYKPAIPNAAVNDCDTCHIPDDPDDARNLFGQEVQILVDAATPLDQWWDQLKELDSDADGQSNAEELGDPCLEWTMAVPAGRTFDISNPGDAQSLSLSPDVCEDPPMMGEGGGGDGSGSGSGDGSGNGMGNGNGMGEGGSEPVTTNGNDRPGDPTFTVAEPAGCASIAGRPNDAGWLVMALLALGLIRRRR